MLNIKPNGIYVDATLGGAGHSGTHGGQLTDGGHLYALIRIRLLLIMPTLFGILLKKGQVTLLRIISATSKVRLAELGVNEIDGFVDLGVSSPQLDEWEHGFS